MKIVQFNDGAYAVRRWNWVLMRWEYMGRGLEGPCLWWSLVELKRAKVWTFAEAKKLLDFKCDYGTPVKQGLEIG